MVDYTIDGLPVDLRSCGQWSRALLCGGRSTVFPVRSTGPDVLLRCAGTAQSTGVTCCSARLAGREL